LEGNQNEIRKSIELSSRADGASQKKGGGRTSHPRSGGRKRAGDRIHQRGSSMRNERLRRLKTVLLKQVGCLEQRKKPQRNKESGAKGFGRGGKLRYLSRNKHRWGLRLERLLTLGEKGNGDYKKNRRKRGRGGWLSDLIHTC